MKVLQISYSDGKLWIGWGFLALVVLAGIEIVRIVMP